MQVKSIVILVAISWGLKLLLVPAYYSTDFAVHQNWLRLTSNCPLSEWYHNEDSKWTLDYPPFFAYFEYLLSLGAGLLDPSITATLNESAATVLFQRVSVMVSDLAHLGSILAFLPPQSGLRTALLYLSPCFLILDNIHFQYNGFLQALLVASVGLMRTQKYLLSALCFSTLLNFKHIYLYCSPAFFAYLLLHYVLTDRPANAKGGACLRLAKLGLVTLLPFAISLGPFLAIGGPAEIGQILSRLFPFGRGLVHDYWAPNFWALYLLLDKLAFLFQAKQHQFGVLSSRIDGNPNSSLKVLPDVPPLATVAIISLLLIPLFYRVFKQQKRPQEEGSQQRVSPNDFPLLVCLSGLIFFLFGFHVHEKAITPYLHILLLFCPSLKLLNLAIFVNLVNLVPLLISPAEKTLSIVLCLLWVELSQILRNSQLPPSEAKRAGQQQETIETWPNPLRPLVEKVMQLLQMEEGVPFWETVQNLMELTGFILLFYLQIMHPLVANPHLEFLPLMLNSVWAATFNLVWGAYLYYRYLINPASD